MSEVSGDFEDTLTQQVPRFLVKYRGIVDRLDAKQIGKLRETSWNGLKRHKKFVLLHKISLYLLTRGLSS